MAALGPRINCLADRREPHFYVGACRLSPHHRRIDPYTSLAAHSKAHVAELIHVGNVDRRFDHLRQSTAGGFQDGLEIGQGLACLLPDIARKQ